MYDPLILMAISIHHHFFQIGIRYLSHSVSKEQVSSKKSIWWKHSPIEKSIWIWNLGMKI